VKDYKVVDGTSYSIQTPDEVVQVLESLRLNRNRVHVSYGDVTTGRDWLEESTQGYIGRSTGSVKIPLLVHNARSSGGSALLDHCIVRIRMSAGGKVLYQHPAYHYGKMETRFLDIPRGLERGQPKLTVAVYCDDKEQAAFEWLGAARNYLRKLGVVAPLVVK